MKAVSFELIQRRAYEIWEQSGYPDGFDQEHWLQAEQELLEAAPERAEIKVDANSARPLEGDEARTEAKPPETPELAIKPRAKRAQAGDEFR